MWTTQSQYAAFQQARIRHWDTVAVQAASLPKFSDYYHERINKVFQFWVQSGSKILEVGCGEGNLLAQLNPKVGVGIDFSAKVISQARKKYPHLKFLVADAHSFQLEETGFDYIILSDLLNDLWDIQSMLARVRPYCTNQTRIIVNSYSHLWEIPLSLVAKIGLAKPVLYQNWLTVEDIRNLLHLSGYEIIRNWQEIIMPVNVPLITAFFNRFLVRFWFFRELALTNFFLARPDIEAGSKAQSLSISIIIPARNEAGNIRQIFDALPEFACDFELIFVEGHSVDDTYETIAQEIKNHPGVRCKLFHQSGVGKGNAVREAFQQADGDILMILDADLTVPFEYLPRFYEALVSGKGEFINGVRLIYPMGKRSMQFLNLLGNKLFGLVFSWILGQPVKDTLCGTKALWRSDYMRIEENRSYFGDFDPFGDFDLILGAAKLGLKITDLPVRYQERMYGTTNIQRWKHGWLLFKMTNFAIRKLLFQ